MQGLPQDPSPLRWWLASSLGLDHTPQLPKDGVNALTHLGPNFPDLHQPACRTRPHSHPCQMAVPFYQRPRAGALCLGQEAEGRRQACLGWAHRGASQNRPVWSSADLSGWGCIWGLPLAFSEGHSGKEHPQTKTLAPAQRLLQTVIVP